MKPHARWARTPPDLRIARALRALGGAGTLGDLVMATGLPLRAVQDALDALLAEERVQVTVAESSVMVYRLHDPPGGSTAWEGTADAEDRPGRLRWRSGGYARGDRRPSIRRSRTPSEHAIHPFDRKTLSLIRARDGVISLAELVEHTGLTVREAEAEAQRLAALFGGEPHASWDGHVVYAFPELVESAHGPFHVREPRPAWARAADPMVDDRGGLASTRSATAAAALGAAVLAWLATFPPAAPGRALVLAAVAGASTGAAFALTGSALRRLARHRWIRPRRPETLRRYLLGHVFETALKGKGVVSVDRALEYLRARTGLRRIRRSTVEAILHGLAREFDAAVTELDGELFFGFRNVKRQFLASHVQRVRLRLGRKAAGRTVFDSGDDELAAAERELEAFDRELRAGG